MTICLCLDDKNGMRFNHRRQSRDAALLEDIRRDIPDVLTIDPCSEALIRTAGIPYRLAPAEPADFPGDAHFFLEDRAGETLLPYVSRVILYRWNRQYPADTYWTVDLTAAGFSLAETAEFPGKSHETITKEVYTR